MLAEYQLHIKRVYDDVTASDGARFLTDRIWPRGIKKADLALTGWLRDACPDNTVRKSWHQGKISYDTFCNRYRQQLCGDPSVLLPIMEAVRKGKVTLLTAVKTPQRSHMPVLKSAILEALANEDTENDNCRPSSAVCYDD